MQQESVRVDQEPKRRSKSLATSARKLSQDAAVLVEDAMRQENRIAESKARLLKIIRTAFANKAVENTIKHHPSLTDEDREFLRDEYEWSV